MIRLLLIFLLVSCATAQKKDQAAIREYVASGNYEKALSEVNGSKSLQESKNQLLFYLERGAVHFYSHNYYQSILDLEKAKEISDQLYLSIKGKVASTLLNENTDQFYGEVYERSHIHFLLSLNHYLVSLQGFYESYAPDGKNVIPQKDLSDSEKRDELFRSRAELVAWDSYLKSINDDRLGKSVYKNDLLAKVWGGIVHETIGTRDDHQIALQLYIDAKNILLKNYNTYPTFNQKSLDFKKDYNKLHELSLDDVKSKYVAQSPIQKELHNYLNEKIVKLAKLYRIGELKQLARQLDIDQKIVNEANPKQKPNFKLVLNDSLIDKKVGQEVYIGLKKAIEGDSGAAKFGAAALSLFAASTLNLLPPPNSYNPAGAYLGLNVAELAVREFAISFELPKIEKSETNYHYQVVALDKNGKEVLKEIVPLINPLGDIAEEAVAESSVARYSRLGARLAVKHATAIAASFATYKALGGGNGKSGSDFLAKNAAVVQYVAASKAIAASESADTRYWSTLPKNFLIGEYYLPAGEYQITVKKYPLHTNEGAPLATYDLGNIQIATSDKPVIKNLTTK